MSPALTNILRNATRSGYLFTMVQKVAARADEYWRRSDPREVRDWCRARAESADEYARERDAALWDEARDFTEKFRELAKHKLAQLGVPMGGGGHYELLYFLTRLKRPQVVLETGVAAGFSSAAVLRAMALNGQGELRSSDFPYFRLERPERFIGCLVDDELRPRWRLETKGDRVNLPKLLAGSGQVDIFHYDSDKSHYGRRTAMNQVLPKLAKDALLLMDDVQDNWFFREFAESSGSAFRLFEFEGKYLGLIEYARR